MPTLQNSYSKGGNNYYKYTGRYNEVTTESKGLIVNDAPPAAKQKRLVTKGNKSASYTTLDQVLRKKGLIK